VHFENKSNFKNVATLQPNLKLSRMEVTVSAVNWKLYTFSRLIWQAVVQQDINC